MKININLLAILFLLTAINLNGQEYMNMSEKEMELPIRELRRNAITGNIGWNGLTGFGVTYNHYLFSQLEADMGVGLASTGFKFGGRMSYLFINNNFSPFASIGFMYGTGSSLELEYDQNNNKFNYMVESSPFLQIAGGVEYMSNGGFLVRGNMGYAILLKETNYKITQGVPTADELRAMDIALGSGIVIEFSIGYAFGGN